MKVILQRVKEASVWVAGRSIASIGRGLCLLVGIEKNDTETAVQYAADKAVDLRIFPDAQGKINVSLLEDGGEVLAVSQFTLAASVTKGRRPSFDRAEDPTRAEELFDLFVEFIRKRGLTVRTGVFGAVMDVHLVNSGPVTFIIAK